MFLRTVYHCGWPRGTFQILGSEKNSFLLIYRGSAAETRNKNLVTCVLVDFIHIDSFTSVSTSVRNSGRKRLPPRGSAKITTEPQSWIRGVWLNKYKASVNVKKNVNSHELGSKENQFSHGFLSLEPSPVKNVVYSDSTVIKLR